jgi:hypothetical protein
MHDEWQPPPVPNVRHDAGSDWHDLWRRAHAEMRPYGRRPSMHLVDQLLQDPAREWLAEHLREIAQSTLATAHARRDGYHAFATRITSFATMRRYEVRVILDPEFNEIVTAIPLRRVRRR